MKGFFAAALVLVVGAGLGAAPSSSNAAQQFDFLEGPASGKMVNPFVSEDWLYGFADDVVLTYGGCDRGEQCSWFPVILSIPESDPGGCPSVPFNSPYPWGGFRGGSQSSNGTVRSGKIRIYVPGSFNVRMCLYIGRSFTNRFWQVGLVASYLPKPKAPVTRATAAKAVRSKLSAKHGRSWRNGRGRSIRCRELALSFRCTARWKFRGKPRRAVVTVKKTYDPVTLAPYQR